MIARIRKSSPARLITGIALAFALALPVTPVAAKITVQQVHVVFVAMEPDLPDLTWRVQFSRDETQYLFRLTRAAGDNSPSTGSARMIHNGKEWTLVDSDGDRFKRVYALG